MLTTKEIIKIVKDCKVKSYTLTQTVVYFNKKYMNEFDVKTLLEAYNQL